MTRNAPTLNQALYASIRSAARTRSVCSRYARYEEQKTRWVALHPGASSREYELAIQSIAKECGV
jgi:hypothetical protein